MSQFSKLFTSDYVKNLSSSVNIPSTKEFLQIIEWQKLGQNLDDFKARVKNFFPEVPTFEEFVQRVKGSN